MAALPVRVLSDFIGTERAYAWVGMYAPLALAAAAMALARAHGVSAVCEILTGTLVVVVPGVANAVFKRVGGDIGIFHPQDVVAAALVLLALAVAIRGRWVLAGILLGAALLTRQWAILATLPVIVAAPTDRRLPLLGAAGAIFALGLLPFLIADPDGTRRTLLASNAVTNAQSLTGRLGSSSRLAYTVSRIGPILGALIVGLFLATRWQGNRVPAASLLGGVLGCLAIRTALDSAFFAYLVPISALVLVMVVARIIPLWAGAGWLIAFGLLTVTSPVDGPVLSVAYALVVFALSAGAVALGLSAVTRQSPAEAGL